MERFPWKVGGRIVLALTVAPALCAGAKLSLAMITLNHVVQAAGGAPSTPAATPGPVLAGPAAGTPVPAAGTTDLAPEAAALAAPAAPSGTKGYDFPMMWYLCQQPDLEPRPDCDPDLVDHLAGLALRGYVAEVCDPEPDEAPLCLEPQPWPEPARLRSAKLATQYRLPAGGRARDLGRNYGEALVTALELDRYVCYALAGYPHVPADRRGKWLYNRLLEAARLKQDLDGTRDQSDLLDKLLARREALAAKAGRDRGVMTEIRMERARVARSRELAGNALGRFDRYAKDLLTCMQPDPPAAPAEPAGKDKARSGSRKHRDS